MRLVSWNIKGKVKEQLIQADKLDELKPDIVALQEVTSGNCRNGWVRLLAGIGMCDFRASIDLIGDKQRGPRMSPVLIASKWRIVEAHLPRAEVRMPWPECMLTAVIELPTVGTTIGVHTIHVPAYTTCFEGRPVAERKIETFCAVQRLFDAAPITPTVLCGDFNSPERDGPDGPIPFSTGGREQEEAEVGVLTKLPGMHDLICQSDSGEEPWSYLEKQTNKRRRFDHVLVSNEIRGCCRYRTDLIPLFSDHAPVVLDFDVALAFFADACS